MFANIFTVLIQSYFLVFSSDSIFDFSIFFEYRANPELVDNLELMRNSTVLTDYSIF